MPVRHLLHQIASFERRRGQLDARPDAVSALIESAADLFDPVDSDVGRVGFDCHFADDRWIVELYLGATEIVGGPEDGIVRHADFRFDVLAVSNLFDEVDQIRFTALPGDPETDTRASLLAEGLVGDHRTRLHVYAVPPDDAGPAFRLGPDGEPETV